MFLPLYMPVFVFQASAYAYCIKGKARLSALKVSKKREKTMHNAHFAQL